MTAPNTLSGRPNTSGTRSGVKGQSPFPLATDQYDKENEQKFRSQLNQLLEPLRKQLAATATLLAAIKASTIINDSSVPGAHVSDALNNLQPLDSDLTAIAALTTASFGRSLLTTTSAQNARSSSFLDIDSATGHGDSNYTILSTDRVVYTNAAFTASRTWTLPAANSVNAGQYLLVTDLQLTVTPTNTLVISRAGSDTIDQAFTSVSLDHAGHAYLFVSDGVSKWRRTSLRTYGTAANNAVVLDANAKLPAVDGSQLTNVVPLTTQGDLLYRDATGLQRLGAGTSGQFLKTLGAGANPLWAGLDVAKLATGTASAQATVDIVLTSFTAYHALMFVITDFVPVTNDVDFWVRVSSNGGSTYDAGATDYRWAGLNTFQNAQNHINVSAGTTQFTIGDPNATAHISNNAANGGISGVLWLIGQTNSGVDPHMNFQGVSTSSGVGVSALHYAAQRVAAQVTSAIRFLFSSGNISTGTYDVYGLS